MQFAFNENNYLPRYIDAEFPVGQSLTAAINIKFEEVNIVFNNLIKAYIEYIDNKKADEYYYKFEKAIFAD